MKKLCALLCAVALLIVGAAQAEEFRIAAYRKVLENLYYNKTFPDGTSDEYANVEGNGFAVYDVDGDGDRELIIQWSDTIVASSRSLIYDCDEAARTLHLEYQGGANLSFFDNGMIEDPLSHNQGPSEYFWPYFLAQYMPGQDVYVSRGDVEAMEREALESYGWDMDFPESVDADGNGVVYCINGGDWVDDGAYRQWRLSYAGAGREMRIPYVDLTVENIRNLR